MKEWGATLNDGQVCINSSLLIKKVKMKDAKVTAKIYWICTMLWF